MRCFRKTVRQLFRFSTTAGLRTVPLSNAATDALLTWKLGQDQERENAAEAWIGDGHVFAMEDRRPLNPSYVTRTFEAIRTEDEELPLLTFHGLRHSAASLMLAGKADNAVLSSAIHRSASRRTFTQT